MAAPSADSCDAYWAKPAEQLLRELGATPDGLSLKEAQERLRTGGPNALDQRRSHPAVTTFVRQFRSPLVLILIFAAAVSAFVGENSEAVIISVIVLASCVLSFTQEYGASRAMAALTAQIARKAAVLRRGQEVQVAVDEIVPGDVIRLSAGNLIPADGVLLAARDFNVSESALTGETFPALKAPGVAAPEAPVGQRGNVVFTGTSVRSGTATMLAVRTGAKTEFAAIAAASRRRSSAAASVASVIGISVDSAVDVAREAANMIVQKRDLTVLLRGVDDGRTTFANTMKYIAISTSANFGNMISMAFASLVLPFLPLLAPQILLNNLLADVPSLAIATDNVDAEQTRAPRHWDIGYVRRFMVAFGLVSSAFDFVTFGFLLFVVGATAQVFQTGWFVESLMTQLAIVMIVRTRQPFWKSRPSRLLGGLTLAIGTLAIAIPYLPGAGWFGFTPLPAPVLAGLIAISLAYLAASEATKRWFFAREQRRAGRRRPFGGRARDIPFNRIHL